jgi:hypothetical protein
MCFGSGRLASQRDRPRDSNSRVGWDKSITRGQQSISDNAPLSDVMIFGLPERASFSVSFPLQKKTLSRPHAEEPPKRSEGGVSKHEAAGYRNNGAAPSFETRCYAPLLRMRRGESWRDCLN